MKDTQPVDTASLPAKDNKDLGTAPILALLGRFAIPSIVAMLVNSLYNIVDQIFIGQYVGYLGNAATSICFPFATIAMAVAMLNSDGCVALFSLLQGRRENERATLTVGNGVFLAIVIGVSITLLFELSVTPLLYFFGATEGTFPYAYTYARITLPGLPLVAIAMCISAIIRADGNPQYSMICMITGCVANVVLDAWFIIGLGWGVAGAAIATVIGQALNCGLCLAYLGRFRTFTLKKEYLKPRRSIVWQIGVLGVSSFMTQLSGTVVIVLNNKLLIQYGISSAYGPDIPVAAFGIVMKCNQILCSVLLGMGVGVQPIIGYNYGAKQFGRVRQAYLLCVSISTVAAVIGWIVFQTCTQGIVSLFGQESVLYNQFADQCFRIFLGLIFLGGFTINSGIFFQAIGKPKAAMVLSLARQFLFYVPAALLLTKTFGLMGCLYTGPVTEILAALLSAVFVVRELRLLRERAQLEGDSPLGAHMEL